MDTPSSQGPADRPMSPAASYPLDLSVVIPAWNEAGSLEETIDRIIAALRENEARGFEWEIVVCDNASTDDTSKIARRAGARVAFEAVRGIARARNGGAHAAHGRWLLFVDADTHPSPELLSDVCALMGDGGVVGCGSMMRPAGGKWWMRAKIQRDNIVLWCLGLAPAVFLLCRHDAFQAIGGFNDDLPGFEELGFVARLRIYGRVQGLGFPILRRHPVTTSARTKGGMGVMIVSYLVGLLILPLNTLLPKRLRIRGSWRLLGFWYPRRR